MRASLDGATSADRNVPKCRQGSRPRPPPLHRHLEGAPSAKDSKLSLRDFDGSEVYTGPRSGFEQWALLFIGQAGIAETVGGFRWLDHVKVNKLGHHLRGMAEQYFQQHIELVGHPTTPWYIFEQLNVAYLCAECDVHVRFHEGRNSILEIPSPEPQLTDARDKGTAVHDAGERHQVY